MKCRELMCGDWCCSGHGLPMRIANVGDDYAYATFEGNEADPWEFDDKDDQPQPIEINEDILKQNKWEVLGSTLLPNERCYAKNEGGNHLQWRHGTLSIWFAYGETIDIVFSDVTVPCKYVHQFQQALRLAGMTDMANNFKI